MVISIIIPTFNRGDFLCEAICKFVSNYEVQFEAVIVDDASTDNTRDTVAALQSQWTTNRIVYIRQETNQGAQAARNRGIESATGQFLLFMDSDDIPRLDGIMKLCEHLRHNADFGYCFGSVLKTDILLNPISDGELVGSSFGKEPREIAGYHWHTMGALYRRSCIDRVGTWNPELTGSQDWEYQARVKLFGGKGEFVDTLVGYWRQHDGERVGTARFRPDYVRSVMRACESILSNARKCGRCDAELEKRIAKRLVIHALEWGTNGFWKERRECFDQAAASLSRVSAFSAAIRAWAMFPAVVDPPLFKFLTKTP